MGRVLLVDILTILFGIGTWVCVNGLWVELPLLVQKLPEAWTLPSYLSVIVQLGNVGPIAYTILNSFFPNTVTEKRAIYLSMSIEALASLLLAFFWSNTTYIFGDERAVGLLSLGFFLALVDCSSRVLFLPFMTKFQPAYLMPYFIGEGLSSFIPSIFSLIQGVGGNPKCRLENVTKESEIIQEWQAYTDDPTFSVGTFFYILFAIMILSIGAFHLLNYNSLVKNALGNAQVVETPADGLLNHTTGRRNSNTTYFSISPSPNNSIKYVNGISDVTKEVNNETEESMKNHLNLDTLKSNGTIIMNGNNNLVVEISKPDALFTHVPKPLFITLLITLSITCSLSNGIFPSIQSYSCLPYGNVAYHWAVTLSSMTNPIVCFLAMLALPKPTQTSILSVGILALGVAGYAFTTAIESPTPPLVGLVSGEALLIISWILLVGLFTYVRISIATILRAEGRRGLFLCGAASQIGSATGALATFFVVNFTETFQSYQACQNGTTIS